MLKYAFILKYAKIFFKKWAQLTKKFTKRVISFDMPYTVSSVLPKNMLGNIILSSTHNQS